jgi:NAD-dependent deacetylase
MPSAQELKSGIEELGHILRNARRGVAFTGAGISTESGIPDFRSPGGLWATNMPIPFDAFMTSGEARAEAWRRKFVMDDHYREARPNRAHEVVAALVEAGRLSCVITQNIDNLHATSGIPADRLVELHGNGSYATCFKCGLRYELTVVRGRFEATGEGPLCTACGGVIKSATISFGQPMPGEAMARARQAALDADVFLVMGSSLVVYPAASFVTLAKQSGATLVIINREPTEYDDIADLCLQAELGDVMATLRVDE